MILSSCANLNICVVRHFYTIMHCPHDIEALTLTLQCPATWSTANFLIGVTPQATKTRERISQLPDLTFRSTLRKKMVYFSRSFTSLLVPDWSLIGYSTSNERRSLWLIFRDVHVLLLSNREQAFVGKRLKAMGLQTLTHAGETGVPFFACGSWRKLSRWEVEYISKIYTWITYKDEPNCQIA